MRAVQAMADKMRQNFFGHEYDRLSSIRIRPHYAFMNMSDDPDKMEFNRFLQILIDGRYLEDPACGIAKLVGDKGREALSEKQEFVFQRHVIDKYVHEECERCHVKIPWCEMFHAIDTGLCAACESEQAEAHCAPG